MSPVAIISRHGTRIIAASAALGILFPELATMLRPFIGDFVVAMLVVSLLRVDYGAFKSRLRRPLRAILSAAWITIALPVIVLSALTLLAPEMLAVSAFIVVFLFSAPPPIVSAPAFAILMGLDGAMVLAVMLLATLAMPLTSPLIASLFVGEALPIGAGALALRLALMISAALLIATLARRALGPHRIDRAKPYLDTVSVSIAVMFAIGAMDGVAERLVEEPLFTLGAAGFAFVYMLAQIGLTFLVFRRFVGVDAIAIAYASGNRNAGLVVAGLGVYAVDDTVWLFFAMSQLPIFVFPLVLAPLGRRLTLALTDKGSGGR